MAIPLFDRHGLLPVGIHDCELPEIKARFGSFRRSSRRPELFGRLVAFISEINATNIAVELLVNGSFVTAKEQPNDIDLILVLRADHPFAKDLTPAEYNVISKKQVYRRFTFDLLVARAGSPECFEFIKFFQQVRLEPGREKGILRIVL